MNLGAQICLDTVNLVIDTDGNVPSQPQNEDVQLHQAPKIFKETCEIDWNQPSKRVYDFVRGLSPYPGAWTTLVPVGETKGNASVLKIFKTKKTLSAATAAPGTLKAEHGQLFVATSDCWLELLDVQASGKKRMAVRDFLNGFKNAEGFVVTKQ